MAALLLVGLIFTACIAAILASWSKNAAAKKQGAKGYEFGRRAGLGEVALDYIKRRTGVNNISLVMTFDGELDAKILAAVLRRAQAKYALFRAYLVNDGTTRFKVLSFTPSLPAIPIARLSGEDWRQVFHAEVNTPFGPLAGYAPALYPLIRTVIITQPRNVDAKCVLHVTVDHRLADGFSAGIIFDELMKDYSAVASGRIAPDAPPASTVPLDPPTEELGPAWLMLPRLFLKLLALALYVAVFVWRFRAFTRLPLRMSAASEAPPPTPPPPRSDSPAHTHPSEAPAPASAPTPTPASADSAPLGAELTPSSSGRSLDGVWTPEPPAVVRGLSHLSGLFIHREPSVQGTLRVPWTTAAVFRTLSEAQTAALLAACKRERVTITAALFAAMSVAIAEKEIKAGTAKFPLLIYSYTLLDLRKLSRKFLNPIRLGLHISSIFSIASLAEGFDEAAFWRMCRKYQADKGRSFMLLEPWRNLLLQWLLAHAAVFISMCNFYRGAGRKLINWLGKSIPSLSPTFAISNMGSLDHFQWTKRGPQLPNTPVVKEVYGAATVPVSWPFCLLLSSSVNGCLKLNFAFAPQALPFAAVESLAERVVQLLDAVATKHVSKDAAKDATDAMSDASATPA